MSAEQNKRRAKPVSKQIHRVMRRATASMRALPSFLIIGGMRCGTTSLYDTLVEHPSVLPAARKEVHFFDRRFEGGVNWYRSKFPLASQLRGGRITGDASPYYIFHPHCADRVKQLLPDVKLIAVLRNPVERAYSHYQHEVRGKTETLSFEEAIAQEPDRLEGERERMFADGDYDSFNYRRYSYLARGIYADQLEDWFRVFDRRQVLVLKSEDLFTSPDSLRRVLDFLGLPAWEPRLMAKHNVGKYSKLEPALRQRLVEYFAPHNRRLYELLGVDYGWQ